MADKRIHDLPAAVLVEDTDVFVIEKVGGLTRKATGTQISAALGGGGSATVADDIAKQGGSAINRVKGQNRIPYVDDLGVALTDGVKPPIGGAMTYNERNGVHGYRAKKPVMPGHFDVEDFGALPYNGVLGTIGTGTGSLVVTDVAQFAVGQDIWVKGLVFTQEITAIVGSTLTVTPVANTDVTNGAIFIDNLPMFNATLAAMETYPSNGSQKFCHLIANGAFFLSDVLEFKRAVVFDGAGRGDVYDLTLPGISVTSGTYPGTYLMFPHGSHGLRFYSSLGGVGNAGRSVIKNLTLSGALGHTEDGFAHTRPTTGHGIYSHTTIRVENCLIGFFGECGVYVLANNSDAPPVTGNASGALFDHVVCYGNGKDGFCLDGGDANIILLSACDGSGNTGWGFREANTIGCTYSGCHAEANAGWDAINPYDETLYSYDGYNHDYANDPSGLCRSVYVGCYSEVAFNRLYHPGAVFGGQLCGTDLTADSTITKYDGSWIERGGIAHHNTQGVLSVAAALGVLGPDMKVMSWDTTTGANLTFLWNNSEKCWEYSVSGSGYSVPFRMPSVLSHWDHYAPWFANGLYIGDDNAGGTKTLFLSAASPPAQQAWSAAASYARGDIVWQKAPVAGGSLGVRCLTAGTQGTLNSGSTTGDISIGTTDLVLSADTGIQVGQYISIVGVTGTKRITALGTAAALTCTAVEPYLLTDGAWIRVSVGARNEIQVFFHTGDFIDISAATAAEIGAVIQAAVPECTAGDDGSGRVVIASTLIGAGSRVDYINGTLTASMGWSTTPAFGSTDAKLVTIDSAASGTVAGAAVSWVNATFEEFGNGNTIASVATTDATPTYVTLATLAVGDVREIDVIATVAKADGTTRQSFKLSALTYGAAGPTATLDGGSLTDASPRGTGAAVVSLDLTGADVRLKIVGVAATNLVTKYEANVL